MNEKNILRLEVPQETWERNILGVVQVFLLQLLKHSDFYFTGVPLLEDCSNDLDSNSVVGLGIDSTKHHEPAHQ